ncbi:hypothetical protein E6R60_04685 [Streptomyces sp. A0642]|nr:hypothetical protein E6R60_04685 [Streptomyces sp. A0642]
MARTCVRAVCRSIAGHTISRSDCPATHDHEDRAVRCPVPPGRRLTRKSHSGTTLTGPSRAGSGHTKKDPAGSSSVSLPRLDSNQ